MDANTVLRVIDPPSVSFGHLMSEKGALLRFVCESQQGRQHLTYWDVSSLDGSRTSGGWTTNRFEVIEPECITGSLALPVGTLLRCVSDDTQSLLTEGTFYRVAYHDLRTAFIEVATLDGQPVLNLGGTNPYGFFTRRFVYYPDSAPAEPTTEKGTTMSNTTTVPLTIDVARTLPIGSVVVRKADEDYRPGERFTLDKAGIDVDGDFHGLFDGEAWPSYQRWSLFDLPDTLGAPEPTPEPAEHSMAAELRQAGIERDAFKADLERVIDALRQEAIDREWCSEYDRFMERLGFEARCTRKFTVRRRAYIEWDVEIEASDEDAAREEADNNEPSYVRDLDSDYLDLESIEIVDVEEA